jgi:Flp pilus assembly pilin Flp
MFEEFQRFLADDSGPEMVEWAVVTIVLLAATFAVLVAIKGALKARFVSILCELAADNSLCTS